MKGIHESAIQKILSIIKDNDLSNILLSVKDQLISHTSNKSNPHKVTKSQVGLGNVDNTSDNNKPVSTVQQQALDDLYQQLTEYTRQKIADLINGASTTMDTLAEIEKAMTDHKAVVAALDAAIGKKANASEFDSHVKDTTKHVTAAERTSWNGKQAAITGGASTITSNNLTVNKVLVSNASGKVGAASVSSTELGYLTGATSNIQDQINKLDTSISFEYVEITNQTILSLVMKKAMIGKITGFRYSYKTEDAPNNETWEYTYVIIHIASTKYLVQAHRAFSPERFYQRFYENGAWYSDWFCFTGSKY